MSNPSKDDSNLAMDEEAYIQKLKLMSLNGQTDPDSRYARILTKSDAMPPTYHQKQRSIGATDSYTSDGPQPQATYKIYERNNIIASSKFATPKQVETIASSQKPVEENDVYVQVAKPQVPGSPTHSLSGSSHHSGSPRASIASPLYENVEYYGSKGQGAFYHQKQNPEPIYRKAQPQVPTGNKHPSRSDADVLPVYENIQELSQKATPGPQVASQAPPYSTYPQQAVYSVMQAPRSGAQTYYQPQHVQKTFTQQQLDEINASDYVCMTGNISHTLSTNTPFQTTSAKSYERAPATGIAGAPTKPYKEVKKPQEKVEVARPAPSPSPTPSTCSTMSGKLKMSGKTLLPYNVTPPRPRGPTEAERKIEEMTRQIEEEMEKHEEEGEYFGKNLFELKQKLICLCRY